MVYRAYAFLVLKNIFKIVAMIHKPILIKNLTLSFPQKTCFEDFSAQIPCGSRIAIIGRNGSGKSSLLKMLQGAFGLTNGNIHIPGDVVIGYVPQIIKDFDHLSGGQRLNEAVTKALSTKPNVLLLDEPTNHLDFANRKSLMRMLRGFPGTLVVVSHDTEFLRQLIDVFWHIDYEKIHVFSGNYDDYMREITTKRRSVEQELSRLDRLKKDTHEQLMKEQARAAKSKQSGEKNIKQKKWPTVVSAAKAGRAEETSGRKKSAIDCKKQDLSDQLSGLRLPEIITPKFSLPAWDIGDKILVSVSNGAVGYKDQEPVLKDIYFSVGSRGRIFICGRNGSGKSTLVRAILNDPNIVKSGNWDVMSSEDIGYLDQHYTNLKNDIRVIDVIAEAMPGADYSAIRRHLNEFLFRKNEEVNACVRELSGGEKARLSLAQIAAKTPKLLILDEITNNLDLETRAHVIEVLKFYPGAMIVISHDADFLKAINVKDVFDCG